MSKNEGKGDLIKPGKQFAKTKPPPSKRTHSDVSPNLSYEEITALNQQIEEMSDDMKSIWEEIKTIMKKDQLEKFIQETVTKIISDLNESIDLMVQIKVDEKMVVFKETVQDITEENSQLKSEVVRLRKKVEALETASVEIDGRSKQALAKANYNEQYSRKNNVKILNIKESQNESENDLKALVCSMLEQKGVSLDQNKIVAIHRIPGKPGLPKPVLMKLTNNNEKAKIMRKRTSFKSTGNRLVDDVTRLNTALIKRLVEHQRIQQAWYFNDSVYGSSTQGKRYKFDLYDNVNEILGSEGPVSGQR